MTAARKKPKEVQDAPLDRAVAALPAFREKRTLAAWVGAWDALRAARLHPSEESLEKALGNLAEANDDDPNLSIVIAQSLAELRGARPLNASVPEGKPTPMRWLIRDWLPQGRAGLLSGEGGLGKSTLTLAASLASGLTQWIDGAPKLENDEASPAVVASWEDDIHEANRRLGGFGLSKSDMRERLRFVDLADYGPLPKSILLERDRLKSFRREKRA